MPPKGRVDLRSLASAAGAAPRPARLNPGLAAVATPESPLMENVALAELVPNPRNPRTSVGDLADLAGIADQQLQPGVAISRKAWLNLWPEDDESIGDAKYIVVNGCRRLAACAKYGRPGMDIVVRDEIASSRQDVVHAVIEENLARKNLDVIEESQAVEALVIECGSADKAAALLGQHKSWVSQRRRLLTLAPELQAAMRDGELSLRKARDFVKVPREEQVEAWQRSLEEAENPPEPEPEAEPEPEESEEDEREELTATQKLVSALKRMKADPEILADAVAEVYTASQIAVLTAALDRA